jgi:hypothetical protein
MNETRYPYAPAPMHDELPEDEYERDDGDPTDLDFWEKGDREYDDYLDDDAYLDEDDDADLTDDAI